MDIKLKDIQYINKYTYRLVFEDGVKGDVDFEPHVWGEAFQKVKDKEYFQRAFVHKTTGTITWPNGVDIAPETLYQKVKA